MGFGITSIIRRASFSTTQGSTKGYEVSKGYLAVYVGDKMRRFVIPVSYLNQQLFQELLNETKEEFGYDHPMGGLTIPCSSFYQCCLISLPNTNFQSSIALV
ncbi:hypothetical protein RYX36_036290 [Vicia faba]